MEEPFVVGYFRPILVVTTVILIDHFDEILILDIVEIEEEFILLDLLTQAEMDYLFI